MKKEEPRMYFSCSFLSRAELIREKWNFQISGVGRVGICKKFSHDVTLYASNTPFDLQVIGNVNNVLATDYWNGCMEGVAVYRDDSLMTYYGPTQCLDMEEKCILSGI
jgi:hypothetical protein